MEAEKSQDMYSWQAGDPCKLMYFQSKCQLTWDRRRIMFLKFKSKDRTRLLYQLSRSGKRNSPCLVFSQCSILQRDIDFTQLTDSNANLIQKPCHRLTYHFWPNIWVPCGWVRLTHKSHHHWWPHGKLLPLVTRKKGKDWVRPFIVVSLGGTKCGRGRSLSWNWVVWIISAGSGPWGCPWLSGTCP